MFTIASLLGNRRRDELTKKTSHCICLLLCNHIRPSCHKIHPFVGQGANLAILAALHLANLLFDRYSTSEETITRVLCRMSPHASSPQKVFCRRFKLNGVTSAQKAKPKKILEQPRRSFHRLRRAKPLPPFSWRFVFVFNF